MHKLRMSQACFLQLEVSFAITDAAVLNVMQMPDEDLFSVFRTTQ